MTNHMQVIDKSRCHHGPYKDLEERDIAKTQNLPRTGMDRALYDQVVKSSPHLWWWVRDKKELSTESIVEGVISNADMDDVLRLFELLGREKVKEIFLRQVSRPRHNYRPQTVNFFRRLFTKDV